MSTTRLIGSVAAESVESLVRMAARGSGRSDLIEIRIDGLPSVNEADLVAIRAGTDAPLILTCRCRDEGGDFAGSESERLELLERAATLGFEYVDVELAAVDKPFPKGDAQLILSHHDFTGLPAEPSNLVSRAIDLGADIVKIAARVSSLEEVWPLVALGEAARSSGKGFIPVAMGPAGVAARILSVRLGADFTYAAAGGGPPTGPGQIALEDMVSLYRFASIGSDTDVYGILGSHALMSRSPRMHNPFFERTGRDAVYVPFQENDLEAFIRGAKRLGIAGLSVTLPFKEAIVPFLDEVDETAVRIGAVNTVVVRQGRWKGYNTDIDGIVEPLKLSGEWKDRHAVVLGSGGAARAAVFALDRLGASVRVLARREAKAKSLAAEVGGASGPLSELADASWDLLINATPVGSAGSDDAGEKLPSETIRSDQCVFDMVTAPELTPLIRRSRDAGARTITGIEMLAAQAVHQAELWTGQRPPVEELAESARGRAPSRYSRQVLFTPIGPEGQRRIGGARALVVGIGALGSVSAEMLVRAGVSKVRIVDRDYVDESNLQRQSLFDEDDWLAGLPKAIAAERKLSRINRDVRVEAHVSDVHPGNVRSFFSGIDLVIDGTDNFESRYLLNDASIETGVPWVYGACVGSHGMSYVVIPGSTPCMRCLFEDEPAPGMSPTCDTAGVIAPIVHAVAAFQVVEALKILAGRNDTLSGHVLSLDVWEAREDRFTPSGPREDCPACGRRELQYLDGDEGSQAVTLCGRNAVQVRPAKPHALDLEEVAKRLRKLTAVRVNPYLLRVQLDERELVLFKDGRAIVHGTEDLSEARSLYARYVGG